MFKVESWGIKKDFFGCFQWIGSKSIKICKFLNEYFSVKLAVFFLHSRKKIFKICEFLNFCYNCWYLAIIRKW